MTAGARGGIKSKKKAGRVLRTTSPVRIAYPTILASRSNDEVAGYIPR
jgi:hypothetical protein